MHYSFKELKMPDAFYYVSVSVSTVCVCIIRFQCFPIHFSIKCHVIAEVKSFKGSVSLLFLLTGLCSLLSLQNPRKPLLSQQRRGNKRKASRAVQLCLLASSNLMIASLRHRRSVIDLLISEDRAD